jgi:transposase-like protein
VRWRWWRRAEQAHEDIAAAQERLDAVEAAEPEVSRVVRELRRLQTENSYSARLAAAFRDHR